MQDLTLLTVTGDNLYIIIDFFGCLVFAFLGSLMKEVYNTNNIDGYKYAPYRVICSTIVGSIASSVFRTHYLTDVTYSENALVTFIFGLLGFEIFKDLTSIEGLKRLINKLKDITGILFGGTAPVVENEGDKNTEDSSEPDVKNKGKFHGSIRGVPVAPKINIHKKDK